ncbi:MAG TPA: lamin tail domain-containing protein, partial [Mycobacteriales bacterium]|nr:lamin tail domain-containing protein [Mycobacteriales bacterium]
MRCKSISRLAGHAVLVTAMVAGVSPLLPVVSARASASGADIEITEIAYGGLASGSHAYPGDSGDGEYVELTNVGTAAQDFTGWTYGVNKSTTTPTSGSVSLSGFGTVQPGESVIITDLTPADFRTEWGLKVSVKVINDLPTTIDSGPDTVAVFDNGGTLVDSVGYAKGAFSGKGVSAEVLSGQTASTTIPTGWQDPSTVGDADGAWTSANGAVGSPGTSALGIRTAAQVREAGETGAAAGADIQITELAYGGLASGTRAYSGDSGDGEYVELTNVGYAAQDFTGWTYGVNKSTTTPSAGSVSLSGFGMVQPGQSVVVTDLTPADFRTEWGLKSSVEVINDLPTTIDSGPDTIGVFNATGVLVDSLGYANKYFAGKGSAAYVDYGQLASTSTATGWTEPATVGDAEGSWTSANGAVGSPGASTSGTSTPTGVRAPASLTVQGASDQTATVGAAFSFTGLSASGGTAPYTWSAPTLAGTGLSIDASTGAVTGTPTAAGVISVVVTVTDSATATANASFTITVGSGIDPNWANIVINEVTSDNSDNTELTSKLPSALLTALNTAPNSASDLVELYNKGTEPVDITGWKQADSHGAASATVFSGRVFNASGTAITSIPGHGYGVFQSGQGLGSGGDAVQIYLPDGTLVDLVTYTAGQAGYDESLDPANLGPSSTETYHALARCPDGGGSVNTNSNDATTAWYSVKVASFGSSNASSCDDSSDPVNAVQYFNQQPPTGLSGTCSPSAPSGSNSVAVPDAVAWPTSDGVTTADDQCEFVTAQDPTGNDMSSLVFSADGSVLWGAQNKNHIWKLVKDADTGTFVPATDNDWANGKAITFTGTDPNASQPDSEGITVGGNGDLYVTSERDNTNSNVSKDEVLEYDPSAAGDTLAPVQQWDLTDEFVPSVIAASGDDANLGFEGVTYVPDSFLVAHAFRDQHLDKLYDPADYPLHGSGLFFLALEKNGHVYAYALNSDGTYQRVADIDTGIDGTSAIADVQFNADDQGLWLDCDNDCGVVDSLMRIDSSGNFVRVASYNRPAGLPNDNLEGFAIAPASTATDGKREVVWSDDGIYGEGNAWNATHTGNDPSPGWGHALYSGTLPVSVAPPVVASVSPSSGSTAGGTVVTITGSGFTGASKVLFGSSTAVTDFSVNPAGTQITVTSPAHAAA